VRNGFIASGKQIFGNNSEALIKAIDPDYMYSVNHFMVHYSTSKGGGPGFKLDEWRWFIKVLVEAGEKNPQVVIPQIVTLVVKEQRLTEGFSHELDEERLQELFGDGQQRVIHLLSKEIDISRFDIRDKDRIQFAQQAAIKWLAVHRETGAVNAATHDS
jgi:hypothetical protein